MINKTNGLLPISMGTSLALTALFPQYRDAEDKRELEAVDIKQYSILAINVHTLLRNVISAIDAADQMALTGEILYGFALTDIEAIRGLLEQTPSVTPVLYVPTYSALNKMSRRYTLRNPTTPKQQHLRKVTLNAIALLEKGNGIKTVKFNASLNFGRAKVLLLTHIPYDLLSYKRHADFALLESNTGVVKKRHQWGSKYHPVGEITLEQFPLSERLLFIFGDKGGLIAPITVETSKAGLQLRKLVSEIGFKCHWNPSTSDEKVLFDLDRNISERYIYQMIASL